MFIHALFLLFNVQDMILFIIGFKYAINIVTERMIKVKANIKIYSSSLNHKNGIPRFKVIISSKENNS